ncbi:hypothetical protein GF314_07255 [bacterium]|nr:hypothetical protein [bacterium]
MRSLPVIVAALLVVVLARPAVSQQYWVKSSTLFVEAMGAGGIASVNFDHRVEPNVALRIGAGSTFAVFEEYLVAPATVSYLLGDRESFLEIGAGMAFVGVGDDPDPDDLLYDEPDSHVAGTAILGYRYHGGNGLFMRLAFTPLLNGEGFVPMGGAAIGFDL